MCVESLLVQGFRKADPDQWEFERENFRRDDFGALSRWVKIHVTLCLKHDESSSFRTAR